MNQLAIIFLFGFVAYTYGKVCEITTEEATIVKLINGKASGEDVDALLERNGNAVMIVSNSGGTDSITVELKNPQIVTAVSMDVIRAQSCTLELEMKDGKKMPFTKTSNQNGAVTVSFFSGEKYADIEKFLFTFNSSSGESSAKKLVIEYEC